MIYILRSEMFSFAIQIVLIIIFLFEIDETNENEKRTGLLFFITMNTKICQSCHHHTQPKLTQKIDLHEINETII